MNKIKLSDIVVVTGNKNKLDEINEILGTNHQASTLDIPEIQSLDLDEVITAKAKAAFEKINKPVLVTDVSLEIEALHGLPGPFVKYFVQTLGPAKTVDLIKGKNKKVKATDALGLYDGRTLSIFKGTLEGTLSDKPRGTQGFGFDVVFIPYGHKKTYAQMSLKEKNKISHRAKALRKLKAFLSKSQ
jgi:non-canonical purine NTP pyrophosphatase (RdgB/HAM1 family)